MKNNPQPTVHPNKPRPRAFSLVEVVMALGISAFAMTTLMALLPMGLASNQDSRGSMEAMQVARQVAADLRMSQADSGVYVSPKFAARLDKSAGVQEIPIEGLGGEALTGHRVALKVLPGSPVIGSPGFYEVAVRVFWGLADPAQRVPDGYSKFVDLYVGIAK